MNLTLSTFFEKMGHLGKLILFLKNYFKYENILKNLKMYVPLTKVASKFMYTNCISGQFLYVLINVGKYEFRGTNKYFFC